MTRAADGCGIPEVAKLPLLPVGTWLRIVDSHDISGGNDDGFSGTYSYRYKTKEGWVLFDYKGPGCIVLFRSIGYTGTLRIYVDTEPGSGAPAVDVSLPAVHAGQAEGFPSHLVADLDKGHGSAWCYVPIPFRSRCLVIATEAEEPPFGPHFYSLWAHCYASADTAESAAAAPFVRTGWTPFSVVPPGASFSGEVLLRGRARATLWQEQESGVVTELRIRLPIMGRTDALAGLRLRCFWDRASPASPGGGWDSGFEPQVDAPLGLFFAVGYPEEGGADSYEVDHGKAGTFRIPLGTAPPRGVALGETEDGWLYCRFPMPYWADALVELVNAGEKAIGPVEWALRRDEQPYPAESGYFCAAHRREAGTLSNREYILDERVGTGRYVGCVVRMSSRKDPVRGNFQRGFLEGDARFYLDDSRSFESASTGTEEYFNWGWYDVVPHDRPFAFPTHGYTEHSRSLNDHSTMYRLHYADWVPYYRSIRCALEHGPTGRWPSDYESVAFFYHRNRTSLVYVDAVDIGSLESRSAHGCRDDGTVSEEYRLLTYEGSGQVRASSFPAESDRSDGPLGIHGIPGIVRSSSTPFSFRVTLPDGSVGLRIRRRLDGDRPTADSTSDPPRLLPTTAAQEAAVLLDGETVGTWYRSGWIARACWVDDDFDVLFRGSRTAGPVTLTIRPEADTRWRAAYYWVFAYV